ncbi:MAG: DUF4836 family protein [Bacteroidetes bacterium]|nr:MAG: DUF4836 family protein [Bacteroidota bacterium]
MKKVLIIVVIIALAGLGAWYFMTKKGGSSSEFASHIPSNSNVVLSFNIASMAQKADLKSLTSLDMFKDVMNNEDVSEDDKALMKSILDDPKSTGIDFKANPTFFVQDLNGKSSTGLLLKLSDAASYEATMKKVMKDAKSNTIGSNTYLQEEGEKTVAMWNSSMALIYTGAKRKTAALTADSILNGDIASMKSSKAYSSLQSNDDIFALIQSGQMYGMDRNSPLAEIDFPKNAFSTFRANFENGKITIKTENIYDNKEDAERMNFQGKGLDKNLIGMVASGKPIMATQMSFDVKKLLTFLMTSKDISNSLSEISEEFGASRKDLLEFLNGDIALAFTDFKLVSKEIEFFGSKMKREVPDIKGAMYFGINNKELLQKIIAKSKMKMEGGIYKSENPFLSYYLVETENGVVIGFSENDLSKVADTKQMSDGEFENIKSYTGDKRGFAYINANITTWPTEMQELIKMQLGEDFKIMEAITSPFDYLHGGAITDQKGESTIYMRDASKNALTQLVEMMNKVSQLVKERNEARQKAMEEMRQMYEDEEMYEDDVVYEMEEAETAAEAEVAE